MAATTVDRQTLSSRLERPMRFRLASGQVIPAGIILCSNGSGEAVNGADTAGLIVQGRSEHRASYAAGDRNVIAERGVFCFANDGSIAVDDIGKLALVIDNQTVGLVSVNSIGAGYIEDVTADGVWIAMLGGKVAAS